MFSRRNLLSLGASSPIALSMRRNRFEVGDLVKLVRLPPMFPAVCPDLVKVNRFYRLAFGKMSRVIYIGDYIGDDGRPELDVSEHVISSPDLVSSNLFGLSLIHISEPTRRTPISY